MFKNIVITENAHLRASIVNDQSTHLSAVASAPFANLLKLFSHARLRNTETYRVVDNELGRVGEEDLNRHGPPAAAETTEKGHFL